MWGKFKQKKKTKQKLLISTIIPLILIPILITIGILIKDVTEVPFIYFKHYPFVNAAYCFLFTLFRVFLYIYYKKYAPITIDFKQFAKYVLLVDQFAYEYKEKYINSKESEEMINYISSMVKLNMTPEIRELIGLVRVINSEKDLDDYLNLKIKIYVLAVIVNVNKPL